MKPESRNRKWEIEGWGPEPEVGGRRSELTSDLRIWSVGPAAYEKSHGEDWDEPAVGVLLARLPIATQQVDQINPEHGKQREREVALPGGRGERGNVLHKSRKQKAEIWKVDR